MHVSIHLSKQAVERIAIETGDELDQDVNLNVALDTLPPQTRKRLITLQERIGFCRIGITGEFEADSIPNTPEEWDKLCDRFTKFCEARRIACLERRERMQAERRSWAMAHGSDYLKTCIARNYDCQRVYVTERAAYEYPGYIVDFDNNARWKPKVCPSEVALEEEARVRGIVHDPNDVKIVWITKSPAKTEDLSQCEAVMIAKFLGKYNLFLITNELGYIAPGNNSGIGYQKYKEVFERGFQNNEGPCAVECAQSI